MIRKRYRPRQKCKCKILSLDFDFNLKYPRGHDDLRKLQHKLKLAANYLAYKLAQLLREYKFY